MREFIAQFCHRNDKRINHAIFDRSYDRPLVEYVIDSCKNLEVIPAIKLLGWEYITDQTEIHARIDKTYAKDPKIRNNKTLERLCQPNQTLFDLLVLHFRVTAKGRTADVTRRVRILKELPGGRYLKNGKIVRLLAQVVDNSTYVKGNVLNFKTTLHPIQLSVARTKLKFTNGESISCMKFKLDLFSKVTNPLFYYLAHYGIDDTIELFSLSDFISITPRIIDPDRYLYLEINDRLYIEVNKKAFERHRFIPQFVATLYGCFAGEKDLTIQTIYDSSKEYWLGRLAEIFSKKRNPEKGERVLISFAKMMDPSSKKRLALRAFHKRDSYTIIRWMMVNYEELLKKDSNDLRFKRIRSNEVLAYFFENYITRNVYSLLNTDNPPFEKYIKLLNSINENTLIRSAQSGGGKGKAKSSPFSMFIYERFNDMDALELARYTLKGPTGLRGGKKRTSLRYRDIYASQFGRFDLNVCSSSDPGLTGQLTAHVQVDENGYFESGNNEPDQYDDEIEDLIDAIRDPEYRRNRDQLIRLELSRDSDGFIRLHRKLSDHELVKELSRHPERYGLYRGYDGFLHLVPKMERNAKGFIKLTKRTDIGKTIPRDPDGFMRLHPVKLKINTGKKKS